MPSLWYQFFVRLVWCCFFPPPMRFWCHSTARGRTIFLLAGPQKTPALSEGITLAVSPNLVPLRFLRSESAPESRNIVLPRASLSHHLTHQQNPRKRRQVQRHMRPLFCFCRQCLFLFCISSIFIPVRIQYHTEFSFFFGIQFVIFLFFV